jgi:hypothetical protein
MSHSNSTGWESREFHRRDIPDVTIERDFLYVVGAEVI